MGCRKLAYQKQLRQAILLVSLARIYKFLYFITTNFHTELKPQVKVIQAWISPAFTIHNKWIIRKPHCFDQIRWSKMGSLGSLVDLHWLICLACTWKVWSTWKLLMRLLELGGRCSAWPPAYVPGRSNVHEKKYSGAVVVLFSPRLLLTALKETE